MDYLLEEGVGSHLSIVLDHVQQAGQTHKVPINVLQDISQLVLQAMGLYGLKLALQPKADSMQSLVFHSNSDVFVLQYKSQLLLGQEMDVPIADEMLEVPTYVHHNLRVDLTRP